MAEARSAVTVIAQHDVQVDADSFGVHLQLKEDSAVISVAIPHPRNIRKAVIRTWFGVQRAFIKGIHPSSTDIMAIVVALVMARVLTASSDSWWRSGWVAHILWDVYHMVPFHQAFPFYFKIAILSIIGGVVGFFLLMAIQRVILRLLYSYKGYLYQGPGKKPPLALKIWVATVRLLSSRTKSPLTYQYQGALPHLPVPGLEHTVKLMLDTVKPILSAEEYSDMETKADQFLRTDGKKLQRLLYLKRTVSTNYVSDWWEKYVYLRSRSSLAINSNYYVLDRKTPTTAIQTARAAQLVYNMMQFKRLLEREELEPLMLQNIVPLCMNQYTNVFGTTRIPRLDIDRLVNYGANESRHIAVWSNGIWYVIHLYSATGTLISAVELETLLVQVKEDSKSGVPESESVASLTSQDRSVWAAAREKYFVSGLNRKSLSRIEKAVMVLALDDNEPSSCSSDPGIFFHGDGTNRWFDKSVSLIVCRNGVAGMNIEHSWADAPVVANLWEYTLVHEAIQGYDDQGHVKGFDGAPRQKINNLRQPVRLTWDLPSACQELIVASVKQLKTMIVDIDVLVAQHDAYGKGYMKKCKVSPDAFIQLALQLAFFRDQGSFALTYESSMTRLYLNGRTETIRSCSHESCDFVRAMEDQFKSPEERLRLLQTAAERHQYYTRLSMSGQGVDRHLFALYVAASGLGIESPFLNSALSMPFKLSTSQQPQEQTKVWSLLKPAGIDKEQLRSPGGGFGPVSDAGYGVSYMIVGEDCVHFHVSSKVSCGTTNSKRFVETLFGAFSDMRKILDS